MGFSDDMVLDAPKVVDLGNGVTVNAGAAVRKVGLNPTDINFLVRSMVAGLSWPQAVAAMTKTMGAVEATTLAGWRTEIERRVKMHGRPMTVADLTTTDMVLPAATCDEDRCDHVTQDVPADVARCILKKHQVGGHVPGRARYIPKAPAAVQAPPAPPPQVVAPRRPAPGPTALATSAKDQCRAICEFGEPEGERCVLTLHGEESGHLFVQREMLIEAEVKEPKAPKRAAAKKEQAKGGKRRGR